MGNLADILKQLGPMKNPVLGTSCTFSIALLYFSRDFISHDAVVTGATIQFLSVAIFLIALCFYFFAFFRLPSSIQELVFLNEAEAAIARHTDSSARQRKKRAAAK